MSYYHLPTNTERPPGRLEIKLSDGKELGPPPDGWTPELASICGFAVVTSTVRPADTATDTQVRSVALVNGVPTETWTSRPFTEQELADRALRFNGGTLRDRALTALTGNSAFLADASVTNAEAVIQTKALTRQVNALIRLTINKLDTIADS